MDQILLVEGEGALIDEVRDDRRSPDINANVEDRMSSRFNFNQFKANLKIFAQRCNI